MKTVPECIPCFIDDISGALNALDATEAQKKEFLLTALRYLADNVTYTRIPSVHITALHRKLKAYLEEPYPFRELRSLCNRAGVKLRERLLQKLEFLNTKAFVREAVIWSIVGNHLDMRTIGVGYQKGADEIMRDLKGIYEEGLAVDHVEKLIHLTKGSSVLFIHDNVGEIALDAILMKALRKAGAVHITSALRTAPLTSDATLEDGYAVGLHEFADDLIPACPDTLGVLKEEMTLELEKALHTHDLIITKGQANFYSFINLREELNNPLCFLLRTKCNPVARLLGSEKARVNVCYVI